MTASTLLQYHMAALLTGFLLDLLIGDPHWMPHPVRWIGRKISFLDERLHPARVGQETDRDPDLERRRGALLTGIVLFSTVLCTCVIMYVAYILSVNLWLAVESVLTCYLLATMSLRRESLKVCFALEKAGKLTRVTFADRAKMKSLADPVMADYAKEIGADAIFQKINAIK